MPSETEQAKYDVPLPLGEQDLIHAEWHFHHLSPQFLLAIKEKNLRHPMQKQKEA